MTSWEGRVLNSLPFPVHSLVHCAVQDIRRRNTCWYLFQMGAWWWLQPECWGHVVISQGRKWMMRRRCLLTHSSVGGVSWPLVSVVVVADVQYISSFLSDCIYHLCLSLSVSVSVDISVSLCLSMSIALLAWDCCVVVFSGWVFNRHGNTLLLKSYERLGQSNRFSYTHSYVIDWSRLRDGQINSERLQIRFLLCMDDLVNTLHPRFSNLHLYPNPHISERWLKWEMTS